MKKITPLDELNLTKEIIASLSPEQLQEIEGGGENTMTGSQFSCLAYSCQVSRTEEVSN